MGRRRWRETLRQNCFMNNYPSKQRMDTARIVGVCSSARDLGAVSELLSALPAEGGVAILVVRHLDPGRERLLAEARAKRTSLPVLRAHDGVVGEQGHGYV